MNFLDLVKARKSVRRYQDRPVARELIDQCLEAARLAPSSCNSQPWSFLVVDDPEIRDELVKKSMSGIYSSNSFVKTAPVIIVVTTELDSYMVKVGKFIRKVEYSLLDIGIACDHFTLQAQELGLGSCWLGWFGEKAVKKVLGLAKSTKIDIMISLGYPVSDRVRPKKRKTLDEIRRYFQRSTPLI